MPATPNISEYLALLSFFVAVFAAMAIPFAVFLDRQNAQLRETQTQAQTAIQQLRVQADVLKETASALKAYARHTEAKDSFVSAVVENVLLSTPAISGRTQGFKNAVNRFDGKIAESVNDLLLFSDSEIERLSAFQAASNRFPSLRTLRKMQFSIDFFKDDRPECAACIKQLEGKLNAMQP